MMIDAVINPVGITGKRRMILAMQKRREIFRELLSKDNVMILTHKSPDGDTLGTAFALCRVYALKYQKDGG